MMNEVVDEFEVMKCLESVLGALIEEVAEEDILFDSELRLVSLLVRSCDLFKILFAERKVFVVGELGLGWMLL
jgi:hypothetical protein